MAYKRKYTPKSKSARRFRKAIGAKRWTKLRNKRLVKTIKRTVMKYVEPKCKRISIANTEISHNTFAYRILLNQSVNMPAQGIKDTERVGDQINMTGWKLKMMIEQKADRPNVTWRYYVVRLPKGSVYGYSAWFEAITNNIMLDDPNKDFVKVLAQGTMRPNQASLASDANERNYSFFKKIWVPHKKLVKFGPADAAVTHNDDDIYFLLGGYDAYGTLSTDIVGNAQTIVETYYRDP